MMNKVTYLKSLFYVAFAASSYGVLATFVKLGYKDGFTTAEVTISQSILGLVGLILIHVLGRGKTKKEDNPNPTKKEKMQLILCGTSFGLTSVFYYSAVYYGIPVSICIVLLMQAVWMGALVDFIVNKKKPSLLEIVAIVAVLFGTLLATDIFSQDSVELNLVGIVFGLLAAITYTISMYASNKIALRLSPSLRSIYLLVGSVIIITLIWGYSLVTNPFDFSIFYKWGILIAVFGTILPPLLFTKGMPVVGIGVGSIIASMELPVSVSMAKFLLGETVNITQWLGIAIILASIVLMNLPLIRSSNK